MNEKPVVEIYRVEHTYPWRFRITYQGITREFAGVPNWCETRRSAAMRAWWRCRWIISGEFHLRYA